MSQSKTMIIFGINFSAVHTLHLVKNFAQLTTWLEMIFFSMQNKQLPMQPEEQMPQRWLQ